MNANKNVRILKQDHSACEPQIVDVSHIFNVEATREHYLVRCCNFYGWVPKSFLDTNRASD